MAVAEQQFDHGQAAVVVPDLTFLGHADTAVQLNGLFADEFARLADLHLGGGHRPRAFRRVRVLAHHGGIHRHAARLLGEHQHIHRAMLQGLEGAEQRAELPPHLEVLDGDFLSAAHRAHRLCAERGERAIDDTFDGWQRGALIVERGVGSDSDAVKFDIRRTHAILMT